jgi:RNA polymerase primary sigma factor
MAKRFAGRGPGMPDLIAEGVVGLVRAVDGYDPEVGTRFSTYAVWWIGQAMRVAVMRDTPVVHVPAYMFGRMANCRKTMRALERRLGRAPSPDEVRRDMDVSPRYMRAVQHAMDACGPRMPWVNKGQDATLGDRVADERESAAETMVVRDETAQHLRNALESLDGRTAEVVAMRFGLDGRESRTLSEIAVAIGTSRERVRQITNCALRALHAKLSQ